MDKIEFGKIVTTHGFKGEFKVDTYTDNISNLKSLKKVYIADKEYDVESIKIFKNQLIVKLKGVESDKQVMDNGFIQKMIEREVMACEKESTTEFFIRDLIGCAVVLDTGEVIGNITYVYQTGSNDVYEIQKQDSKHVYVPAIASVIQNVNIKEKKIVIHAMEGLEL